MTRIVSKYETLAGLDLSFTHVLYAHFVHFGPETAFQIFVGGGLGFSGGSRGGRRRRPPTGPDYFILTYKFFET